MNLKEFFEKNPGLLSQFKKCASKDDFMSVAQENNIRFAAGKLDEVYLYVKSIDKENGNVEVGDDVLSMASGGMATVSIPEIEDSTSVTNVNLGGKSDTTLIQ